MARNAAVQIENSFVHGLITEATGLNFPESASTETFDCIFDEKGRVYRRLGFDYEEDYALVSSGSTVTGYAVNSFVWTNVGGDGDLTFSIVQLGNTLYAFKSSEIGSLSGNQVFTVNLLTHLVSGAPSPSGKECTFSTGNGALFVSHPYLEPFYVEWDQDTQVATSTTITIEIRDFAGVEDSLAIETRPSTLSTLHKYNLYNQGWYKSAAYSVDTDNDPTNNTETDGNEVVLTRWDAQRSDFPSNSDVWWTFKNSYGLFMPTLVDRESFRGNTKAPRGHYILQAFRQDRTTASGISGLTVITSGYKRPSSVAFHSDRVFFAGVQADDYTNKIYFSQTIEEKAQYGRCYQANDPTSEDISDLLPTDGGVISILGAGTIKYMCSVQNSLLVFCTNGIWAITGSEGAAIAANDYSVSKISEVSTQSSLSFVSVNGFPMWWTNDGIYTAAVDRVSGTIQVQAISDKTIKTFYDEIPTSSKAYAKGAFNTRTKVVQWVYRNLEGTELAEYNRADRVLAFNTLTGAFYPWRISEVSANNGPWIEGIISIPGIGAIRQGETVTDSNGDAVTDSLGLIVTANVVELAYLTSSFQYITIVKDSGTFKITISQEKDPDYVDWATADGDGIDFESYAFSGFKVHGQGVVKFQSNYLSVFMDTEENSSCLFQGWWNYANTINSGRVSTPQQVYFNNEAFTVSKRRIKIRGHGIALQFKFYSESGKPFTIIGWSGFETGNTLP